MFIFTFLGDSVLAAVTNHRGAILAREMVRCSLLDDERNCWIP